MSEPINDGGPAYPDYRGCAGAYGMSYLDACAIAALPSIITQNGLLGIHDSSESAAESYRYADAMLAERSKRK